MQSTQVDRTIEQQRFDDLTRLPTPRNTLHGREQFGGGGDCALPQCMPSRVLQDDRFQFHPDDA